MPSEGRKRWTPASPSLSQITDPNLRRVLESLVGGWRTRNGELDPESDERFITKGEIQGIVEKVATTYLGPGGNGSSLLESGTGISDSVIQAAVARLLEAKTQDILSDPLWSDLGNRIQQVDIKLVEEQLARIAAVQQVADNLAAEAEARLGFDDVVGSRVSRVEEVNTSQATQISGLTTRVSGAESTIVSLQQTSATQATTLTALNTRAGTAESNISNLQTTAAAQATALTSLDTRVGSSESKITTLQTTTSQQAQQITLLGSKTDSNAAAITSEATTRANADNAITSNVNAQISLVNSSLSAVQTKTDTLSNTVSSYSGSITTLQSQVGTLSSDLSFEVSARVSADGAINSKYAVKIDTNGYVSGFGLMSTANDSTPTSSFIIRADKFAIGSPSGPSITPKVPFIVYATPRVAPDGVTTIPAGVYIDQAVIGNGTIGSAQIGVATIDTLKIGNEAVFVARWSIGYVPTTFGQVAGNIAVLYLPISGLPSGATASVILNGIANYSPSDGTGASIYTNITVNGSRVTSSFGVSIWGGSVFHGNSAVVALGNGVHTIALTTEVGPPGAATKFLAAWGVLTAQAGKR